MAETTVTTDALSTRPLLIGLCSPVMGSGKTTFAEILVRKHGFIRLSVASTLKAMTRTFLEESGMNPYDAAELIADPELKEMPLKALNGKTPRYAMQTLGTEWGRTLFGEDFWINAALSKARSLMAQGYSVVFDDVRFTNEADAIVAELGCMIRVIRPGVDRLVRDHPSEGELDDYPCAFRILNYSTPAVLEAEAAILMRHF